MEAFTLDGYHYFQQFRKCNKPGCGENHGPYWFRRKLGATAGPSYVGRALPSDIAAARQARDLMYHDLAAKRAELARQARALERLLEGGALSPIDEQQIIELGFGACLVGGEEGKDDNHETGGEAP